MVRAAKAVEGHYFELGLFPERFVSIALSAPTDSVALGEPMAVTVALKNVSRRPVFLGPDGLFTPVVFLSLAIDGKAKANLENLTAVPLPAPKRLSPGQEVVETVRVDVGPAEQLLMAHPFAELQVTVTAMVDPLQRGEEMVSSVPSIRVAPVTIRRPALFDVSKGATAAQYALGHIAQRDLKAGDLPTQLRAARQTASLLAHVRRAEAGKAEAVYPDVLTKPILLSMTRAFLRDRSPVLRAGMIAALQHVDLDERIIGLLGPNVQDPSAIVRMRLIELLAGKRTRGYETLVDFFAKDRSVAVRGMAAAMGAQP